MMDGRWSVGRWSLVIGRWSMVDGHSHGHGHGQKCLESLSVHSLCQNSKVAVSESLTKVRYRAARAAKNTKIYPPCPAETIPIAPNYNKLINSLKSEFCSES